MFSQNFVKPGLIDLDLAKVFYKLFDLRHNNDYEDYCFCERQTLEKIRPLAGEFISTVEAMLNKSAGGAGDLPEVGFTEC